MAEGARVSSPGSYYGQRITLNDVSSYLGARVKHIPALERAAFMPAG